MIKKIKILIFVILFFLVLIFFYDIIFLNQIFISGDLFFFTYPNKVFISECFKNGKFPLFNPYICFGFPIFAEGEEGILYPLNLILLFLPPYLQINYSIIIHFLLSGIFMILFSSLFIIEKRLQLLSAIMWIFSGLFIYRLNHLGIILSMTYIPLIFYLTEKYIRESKIRYAVLFALVVLLEILIGHPQEFFYTILALIIYYFLRMKNLNKKMLTKENLFFMFCFIAGISIGAVQILPTIDLTLMSVRSGGMSQKEIFESERIGILNFLNIIYPYLFGSSHNNTYIGYYILNVWFMSYVAIYTGIITFLCLILGVKHIKREKILLTFFILIVFSIFFSFGSNFYLNKIILNLPLFNLFRNPVKMLQIYTLFVILFTTFVLEKLKKEDISNRFVTLLLFILTSIIIFLIIVLSIQNNIFNIFSLRIEEFIKQKIMNSLYHHYEFEYYIEKLKNTINFISKHIIQQNLFIIVFLILFLFFRKNALEKTFFLNLIIFFTFLELFLNFHNFNMKVKKDFFMSEPEIVKFLKKQENKFFRILQWRFFEYDKKVFKKGRANSTYGELLKHREILQPNTNITYKILSYWGFAPIFYKKYTNFYYDVDYGNVRGTEKANEFLNKGLPTLTISGVKYIISPFELNIKGIIPIYKINDLNIYENKFCNELVKFFTNAKYINDENDILMEIREGQLDFTKVVLVNEEKKFEIFEKNAKSNIEILNWENGKIIFNIETDKEGIVVISNYFDSKKQNKDWLALVNGKKTEILNVNYIFMGINIKKGKNRVEIFYKPYYLKIGILVTIISTFLFIVGIVLYVCYQRKKQNY